MEGALLKTPAARISAAFFPVDEPEKKARTTRIDSAGKNQSSLLYLRAHLPFCDSLF
jgi:hypothetical protein